MDHRRHVRLGALAAAVVALVLAAGCKPIPAEGLYSSPQHTEAELTTITNLTYGSAVNVSGTTIQLRLDLYLPPAGGPDSRPTVVAIHGGGFTEGNKSQMAGTARSYAVRGFVAASISYRLDPGASASNPTRYFAAALNAIDDGMESVRWLRANAATYRIDPTRIAMVGSSAGGALALGVAAHDDPTPGGPLAAYSPKINVAVSTGAALTPGFDAGLITAHSTDAPSMLFHYEVDTVTGFTDEYANEHCAEMAAVGAICQMRISPGSGHTVGVGAGGTRWTNDIGPFLWNHLRLHPPA